MRRFFALAALMLLPLPSLAGPQDAWTVDPKASSLSFSVAQVGSIVSGRFTAWTGEIVLDPNSLASARIDSGPSLITGATAAAAGTGAAAGSGTKATALLICWMAFCSCGLTASGAMSRHTCSNLSTTTGSYIVPRRARMIARASSSLIAPRYGRSDVSAS